jgi:hypothetical protein
MKKHFTPLLMALLLSATSAVANSGIWRGSIDVNLNSSVTNYRDGAGTGTNLSGASLGTITNSSTFLLQDLYLFSWKNNGCDVFDARMYYRVYKQGSTPGAYASVELDDFPACNCGEPCWRNAVSGCGVGSDQEWGAANGTTIDLKALALAADGTAGTYVLQVYWETNVQFGDCGTTTRTTSAVSATFLASTALPIELTDFQAVASKKSIDLIWQTLSERDHDRFEVERSADGTNWTTIGTIRSLTGGQSDLERSYQFEDASPLAGANFYRLRQIDLDGRIAYSPVVRVFFGLKNAVSVWPNPLVGEQINLQISDLQGDVVVRIFDAQGRELRTQILEGEGTQRFQLSTEGLPEGILLLQVGGEVVRVVR